MKVNTNPINELLSPLRQYFQKDDFEREDVNEKPPLRSELFSMEQMEHHATILAVSHQLSYRQAPEQLLKRLSENEEIIVKVTDLLHSAVRDNKPINPAGDWLLDNFYLIEEQIRIGKRHLSKGYSKGLPRLEAGKSVGMPRVYDIALEIISHSDGHVNIESLSSFIASYQKTNDFTLGELWAIPIMLRLALIENLRRVAARIAVDLIDADLADVWANRMIEQAEKNPKDMVLTIGDMARSKPPIVSAFVAKFVRRLQLKGLDFSLPLSWLEQHLSDSGYTINSIVLSENQKQAADQVSMSNSISSLRFLTKTDWRDFVELMSTVEQTLRKDPSGIYQGMDFHTRDRYRHAVEHAAKKSTLSESEVAQLAIRLTIETPVGEHPEKAHVGYYLIGKGLILLEKAAAKQRSFTESIQAFFASNSYVSYVAATLMITIGLTGVFQSQLPSGIPEYIFFCCIPLFLIVASHLAISLVNWQSTLLAVPEQLPKMDFSKGIPDACRTLVVVPSMLANPPQVEKLLEELEVRFLSNRDPNLHFALLTDWKDAASQTTPEDAMLLRLAQAGITSLNRKYGRLSQDTFFLFHRPRTWNANDKIWMGYERKRGKLGAMNQLLRGKGREHFSTIIGDEKIFTDTKYVITLDTDTQLPREAAWKLVGLMAHPLNRPIYSEKKKRIISGFGIIQPRLAISLHGATRSLYSKLYENDIGIDPYTRVTSDIYQDVFGEGSFIGKGIYEVDAFEKVTANRFPENRILSHDLLEGAYARCGFASDVQFYEDHPSSYITDINRRHRWIRGDWQVGSWALPFVPGSNKKWEKNPLNALSKWKIIDNLRRSLLPIAFMIALLAGWTLFHEPWFWTGSILIVIMLPSLLIFCRNLLHKPKEIDFRQHFEIVVRNTSRNIIQSAFTLAMVPYEAFISLDAIFRTVWRMTFSGKKLLEWNPSGFSQNPKENILSVLRKAWMAPPIAAGTGIYLINVHPYSLPAALPFLFLWLISPLLIWWISRPLPVSNQQLNEAQKLTLRELSRRTWAFFEDLVGPDDNWLPPDNYQLYPIPVIARRTSPTNIGLSLLSNLAAYDFGYATTAQLLERTEKTFETLEKMERHSGHFYNWYDTQTLDPLPPRYISTVDSGNLAGHLLTLRQGLLELPHRKLISEQLWQGLGDTIRLVLQNIPEGKSSGFYDFQKEFERLTANIPQTLDQIKDVLQKLSATLSMQMEQPIPSSEALEWMQALTRQFANALAELNQFAPWLAHPDLLEPLTNKEVWNENCTLEALARRHKAVPDAASTPALPGQTNSDHEHPDFLESLAREAAASARRRLRRLRKLADHCTEFASLQYDFLYDKSQHLLSIGYNVDHNRLDDGFYDLLASEARLSYFVAIAQGKLPQESWFALGRRLTSTGNTPVLLSWSGSMFEFLMPNLVMPSYNNTLLDTTSKGSVQRQIEYGRQQNIPWGISESCYNMVDSNLTYQYKAFGVPGLGFKRGLGMDLVIAPYATVMALMVDPLSSFKNLTRLHSEGFHGKYGFFEAVDYTQSRLPRAKIKVVIQTFMAHHQGMGFLSLASLLLDQPMQRRFEADTQFQTALLLLQERVPKSTGYYVASAEMEDIKQAGYSPEMRVFNVPNTPAPEVQLLSNGRYHVMVTNAGSGYSRWKELAVTRWREDSTTDNWGSYCYIRNLKNGNYWSTAYQPSLKEASKYAAVFSEGRVEFTRLDEEIETYTEIIVSPEDDIEIRRSKITNRSNTPVSIEVTSYAEVVLASAMSDDSHPAFSNLFVQTELLDNQQAILCTRRPRSNEEHPPWMMHLMKATGGSKHQVSYETDRNKFIGRGNTLQDPEALQKTGALSNSHGSVLDPIVSIRYTISLEPKESVLVDIITGIGDSRENGQLLIDKYQDRHMRDRAFELSFTHAQVVLRQINASEADAQLYNQLASPVIYANPVLRANQATLIKNHKGQSALWSYSISGDIPIILLQVSDSDKINLVRQLIQARGYWQFKGLIADLVILNEDPSGYRQVLQEQIQGLIAAGIGLNQGEKQGGIFVRSSDQIPAEDHILMKTVARVIISDTEGTLSEQLNRKKLGKLTIPALIPVKKQVMNAEEKVMPEGLKLFNGFGGFTPDGKEYIILTDLKKKTPLPWSNVIANKNFGTIVTESGSSYTWAENAHSYRLTPWHNDPVKDINGEALYLRDEETGNLWSPSPLPARGKTSYITRHGFGYTVFEHQEDGIASELWVYVDIEASIKFMVLKVKNRSGRYRKLSATGYVEWVLGSIRARSSMYTVVEKDISSGALLARNSYTMEFPNHVSFLHTDETNFNYTADRYEFIGRNGSLQKPKGLKNARLSDKYGAGLDPCAAIQVPFELDNGHEKEIVFKIGTGKNLQDATELIQRFKGRQAAANALQQVHGFWNHTLSALQINTPDAALNLLTNGWLVYQVLSCRLWGRSGFYQSGGAFGFRDQLQDVMSLIHAEPSLTRQQILLSASRQFPEGDVQHWWHPPLGRGVRTLCSDDYLWLPFATARYVGLTGDTGVLEEMVSFIEGRQLNAHEESYYDLPVAMEQSATLYEHCRRSIRHGLRFGAHGLPFIGSGDWNDGMNMVGIEGKGESVWLAWFLYDVLTRFSKIALLKGDVEFAEECISQASLLKQNIHKNAWDGEWYIRAYFDDGTPLGSSTNTECRIDAISQSWSVLSEAGDPQRALTAMESVNTHLVNRPKQLIQLLDPPFDKSDPDPGYIRGYVPGVRENGGQYTHAAIWTVMAYAKLGNRERTWELLKLINPLNHGLNAADIANYKAEPYVMAADVYGVAPHTGRGGWTWYTGSAGWMYTLITESFLGLQREGNTLKFTPCIPADWNSFSIRYRYHATIYQIEVLYVNSENEVEIIENGIAIKGNVLNLSDDQREHKVVIKQLKKM